MPQTYKTPSCEEVPDESTDVAVTASVKPANAAVKRKSNTRAPHTSAYANPTSSPDAGASDSGYSSRTHVTAGSAASSTHHSPSGEDASLALNMADAESTDATVKSKRSKAHASSSTSNRQRPGPSDPAITAGPSPVKKTPGSSPLKTKHPERKATRTKGQEAPGTVRPPPSPQHIQPPPNQPCLDPTCTQCPPRMGMPHQPMPMPMMQPPPSPLDAPWNLALPPYNYSSHPMAPPPQHPQNPQLIYSYGLQYPGDMQAYPYGYPPQGPPQQQPPPPPPPPKPVQGSQVQPQGPPPQLSVPNPNKPIPRAKKLQTPAARPLSMREIEQSQNLASLDTIDPRGRQTTAPQLQSGPFARQPPRPASRGQGQGQRTSFFGDNMAAAQALSQFAPPAPKQSPTSLEFPKQSPISRGRQLATQAPNHGLGQNLQSGMTMNLGNRPALHQQADITRGRGATGPDFRDDRLGRVMMPPPSKPTHRELADREIIEQQRERQMAALAAERDMIQRRQQAQEREMLQRRQQAQQQALMRASMEQPIPQMRERSSVFVNIDDELDYSDDEDEYMFLEERPRRRRPTLPHHSQTAPMPVPRRSSSTRRSVEASRERRASYIEPINYRDRRSSYIDMGSRPGSLIEHQHALDAQNYMARVTKQAGTGHGDAHGNQVQQALDGKKPLPRPRGLSTSRDAVSRPVIQQTHSRGPSSRDGSHVSRSTRDERGAITVQSDGKGRFTIENSGDRAFTVRESETGGTELVFEAADGSRSKEYWDSSRTSLTSSSRVGRDRSVAATSRRAGRSRRDSEFEVEDKYAR